MSQERHRISLEAFLKLSTTLITGCDIVISEDKMPKVHPIALKGSAITASPLMQRNRSFSDQSATLASHLFGLLDEDCRFCFSPLCVCVGSLWSLAWGYAHRLARGLIRELQIFSSSGSQCSSVRW